MPTPRANRHGFRASARSTPTDRSNRRGDKRQRHPHRASNARTGLDAAAMQETHPVRDRSPPPCPHSIARQDPQGRGSAPADWRARDAAQPDRKSKGVERMTRGGWGHPLLEAWEYARRNAYGTHRADRAPCRLREGRWQPQEPGSNQRRAPCPGGRERGYEEPLWSRVAYSSRAWWRLVKPRKFFFCSIHSTRPRQALSRTKEEQISP